MMLSGVMLVLPDAFPFCEEARGRRDDQHTEYRDYTMYEYRSWGFITRTQEVRGRFFRLQITAETAKVLVVLEYVPIMLSHERCVDTV